MSDKAVKLLGETIGAAICLSPFIALGCYLFAALYYVARMH
jgi:hypothetical protein